MQNKSSEVSRIGRRAWIRDGSLFLAMIGAGSSILRANEVPKTVYRWGLLTDLHFAEKDSAGTRFYRQTLTKVEEALAKFAELRIDGLVELGDLVDAASSPERKSAFSNRSMAN